MVALVSPQGTRVEADGDLAARLARKGWKPVTASAPVESKRRGRPPKAR